MLSAQKANRAYFRKAYKTGMHGWETVAPSPYAVAYLREIRSWLPDGTLLDLGCGEGRHSIAATRLGFDVTGIDLDRGAVERAQVAAEAAGLFQIHIQAADVFRLPFSAASFDVVLDYGCLHHQRKTDWPAYLVSVRRVLRVRGFYILSVFSPEFRLFSGSRRPWHIAHGAYRRCFTEAEIRQLVRGTFDVLKLEREPGFWHALLRKCG
jgi:SAM-dependent methyltransferase